MEKQILVHRLKQLVIIFAVWTCLALIPGIQDCLQHLEAVHLGHLHIEE